MFEFIKRLFGDDGGADVIDLSEAERARRRARAARDRSSIQDDNTGTYDNAEIYEDDADMGKGKDSLWDRWFGSSDSSYDGSSGSDSNDNDSDSGSGCSSGSSCGSGCGGCGGD